MGGPKGVVERENRGDVKEDHRMGERSGGGVGLHKGKQEAMMTDDDIVKILSNLSLVLHLLFPFFKFLQLLLFCSIV